MAKNYTVFWAFISFLLVITLPVEGVTQTAAKPQITSNLRILEPPPYKVGQSITAEFSIRNTGTAPITFDVLTVGGRLNGICPQNKCPDFEFKYNVSLPPNGAYTYRGRLKLQASGNYHFFTAYRTKDGQWNTAIPTLPGVTNIVDITVSPQVTIPQVNREEMEKILQRDEKIRAYTEEDCINTRKWQIYNEKKSKDPRIISIETGPTATKHYAIPILQEIWDKSLKQAQEECRKKK